MMKPPTGARAERQSFNLQSVNLKPSNYKVPEDVVKEISAHYPRTEVPAFIQDYTQSWFVDSFNEALVAAIGDMDADKAPGALWENLGTTNQDVISYHYEELRSEVWRLVDLIVNSDMSDKTAEEIFMKTGVAYKVFVKGELHTTEKIREGRQRLIFSSPLAMTLLERMWFGPQNSAEIKLANQGHKIPSKPGAPFTEEGALALRETLISFGKRKLVSTDQKGWDTHVKGWLMDADIRCRYHLLDGDAQSKGRWMRGAVNLNVITKRKTVIFSDGQVVFQDIDGWWPSGSYRTSSTNSRMRLIVRRLAAGDCAAMTMGDDATEGDREDLAERYALYGFKLKQKEPVTVDDFTFCSKHFRKGIVLPVDTSVRKMILNAYLHSTEESRSSIRLEMKNHPDLQYWVDMGVLDPDPTEVDCQD